MSRLCAASHNPTASYVNGSNSLNSWTVDFSSRILENYYKCISKACVKQDIMHVSNRPQQCIRFRFIRAPSHFLVSGNYVSKAEFAVADDRLLFYHFFQRELEENMD